jgi:hypothetical protein
MIGKWLYKLIKPHIDAENKPRRDAQNAHIV